MTNKLPNLEKYARLYCYECKTECFLTKEEYNNEMLNPWAQWRCKNCGVKGCDFDDGYWEENEGINENDQH